MAKIDTIKEFAQLGFTRLDGALKDLPEEHLDWKSCSEANTIRNIVNHLLGEWYGFIPKIIAGNKDAETAGYDAKPDKSLKDLMKDYDKGKKDLMAKLDKVKDTDLAKEMDWFMGKKPVGFYLMLGVSEIVHHEGQIAAIRGVNKRLAEA
ncbi:MAG: DinB family protein [Candidatus Bathyarchaeota archaeon]|nr:DinB family protein [Candidatus Bathyarchaeota archaeon]